MSSDTAQDARPTQDGGALLATELRIRLLETLVGLDTAAAQRPAARERSIALRGQAAMRELYEAVDRAASGSEPVKRFLEGCQCSIDRNIFDTNAHGCTSADEANKPLLVPQMTPAMQAAAASSRDGHDMTPHAKAALLLDAEQEIRALERDLREIEILEKRGAAGAGKLAGWCS